MSDVTVWIATIRTGDGRETTAWSAPDKARGYVEHQSPVEVDWKHSDDTRDRAVVAGEIIGTVERAPVQDPAALSQQYPDEMPSTRLIKPGE